jgi:hypothetical protein
VVSVPDGGFDWADAAVGAAATLATTLLALGLVLALRPDTARAPTVVSVARARTTHTDEEEE